MSERPLHRAVRLWLASFLAVAFVSVLFFHTPLIPLAIAGVITLAVTLIWSLAAHKGSP